MFGRRNYSNDIGTGVTVGEYGHGDPQPLVVMRALLLNKLDSAITSRNALG